MPPGTGDMQLSLAQSAEVAGAVIVTTPQDLALADARKGIEMFQKVGVPILGVVENMAMHVCSQCGNSEAIFGLKAAVAWQQNMMLKSLEDLRWTYKSGKKPTAVILW